MISNSFYNCNSLSLNRLPRFSFFGKVAKLIRNKMTHLKTSFEEGKNKKFEAKSVTQKCRNDKSSEKSIDWFLLKQILTYFLMLFSVLGKWEAKGRCNGGVGYNEENWSECQISFPELSQDGWREWQQCQGGREDQASAAQGDHRRVQGKELVVGEIRCEI